MPMLNSPTARSIIYLCCIGGLLIVNSTIVMLLWNDVLLDVMESNHDLTFLEGAGITAFAYVVVFSVRYGMQARRTPPRGSTHGSDTTASERAPGPAQEPSDPALRTMCNKLSDSEKAELKKQLINNCGCTERTSFPR